MRPTADYAVIGGTGVYTAGQLEHLQVYEEMTEYGHAQAMIGEIRGKRVAFLPRHGLKHQTPPHLVNYRANIRLLQLLGVQKAVATAAVGSLRKTLRPGQLVLLTDFLDFTRTRSATFYEEGRVVHIDMSDPYCQTVRSSLDVTAKQENLDVIPSSTYVCTEGPRFETPAEIRYFAQIGGDVVGMTSVPEVVLAKEAGICYASIGIVTNFAAGISTQPLTHEEVVTTMSENIERVRKLMERWIEEDNLQHRPCSCAQTVQSMSHL